MRFQPASEPIDGRWMPAADGEPPFAFAQGVACCPRDLVCCWLAGGEPVRHGAPAMEKTMTLEEAKRDLWRLSPQAAL